MGLDYSLYDPADFGRVVCNPVLETAEIKYSVQPGCRWLDPGYYPGTKQAHSGIDLNDVRGKDSDLGNRVRACADGVVVAAGQYPDWGGIVLIYHPQFRVWTQYAHLTGIPMLRPGQRVRMGDILGHIGKGEHGQFWAHLHFEVRISDLPPNYWPSARYSTRQLSADFIRKNYVDPEKWLEQHSALRTLNDMERVRRSWVTAPVVVPRQEAPPAVSVQSIPALPQSPKWEQVWEPGIGGKPPVPVPGLWVSLQINKATGQHRIFRVPDDKLKERGLK